MLFAPTDTPPQNAAKTNNATIKKRIFCHRALQPCFPLLPRERLVHRQMEEWRGKEVVQATIGDDGDKGRGNEAAREGYQHNDNQIKKGDCRKLSWSRKQTKVSNARTALPSKYCAAERQNLRVRL